VAGQAQTGGGVLTGSRGQFAKLTGVPERQLQGMAISRVRKALKDEFDWAEKNWKLCQPR
jgi:hypothetical protein